MQSQSCELDFRLVRTFASAPLASNETNTRFRLYYVVCLLYLAHLPWNGPVLSDHALVLRILTHDNTVQYEVLAGVHFSVVIHPKRAVLHVRRLGAEAGQVGSC